MFGARVEHCSNLAWFLWMVYSRYGFYVVLLPAKLHFPSMEKVCLQIQSDAPITEKILLTVTLEVKGQKMELIKYNGFACALLCQTFTVPPPEGGDMEVGTVHVEGKGGVKFTNQKRVQIQRIDNGVVIQTDKPTYRPGQTLLFRVLTLNEKFLTPKKQYNLIELKDAKNNRIAQWQNIYTTSGIVDLSFNLTDDPLQGIYTISVENGQALKTFIVNEDVLPRFEVTIDSPNKIFIRDSSFHLMVCSRYTYGKTVAGIVVVNMCRASYAGKNVFCVAAQGQTNSSGCFSSKIGTDSFNLTMYGYMDSINIIASVDDSVTGVSVKARKTVPISRSSGALRFEEMDSYYKAGSTYLITLVMEDLDGRPIQFTDVSLQITFSGQTITVQDKTNATGRISFKLDTSMWTGTVQLTGFYKIMYIDFSKVGLDDPFYNPCYHSVLQYYSSAQSVINMRPVFGVIPCGQKVIVEVTYELYQSELWPGAKGVEFSYIVIGGPGILLHGTEVIRLSKENPVKGSIGIPIVFKSVFAPSPAMIGYILLKGGVMAAGRLRFSVEKCFPNKVNLRFPVKESLPKAQMDLLVLASPSSWCGLRVVDKSTQILYADQEFTSEKIYSMFPYNMRSGYDYIVDESQPGPCWGPIPLEEDVPFRRPWRPWNREESYMDILGLFKDASVKILTNVQIQKLVKRINCWYPVLLVDMAAPEMMKEGHEVNRELPSMPIPEAAVRKNFPETWLWSLVSVGNTGQTRLKVTVPDTITEWRGGIICTGISGFGLSPPASLRVFKSLFVEMSLPYSVVRGELFTLKASVFNYLRVCIKVEVSVSASTDVQVAPCPGCQYSLCVCSNRAVLFKWDVTAKTAGMATFTVTATTVPSTQLCEGQKIDLPAAGRIDIERRQLLVKPGGIRKEEAQSFIFCLKDTNNVATGSCSLQLPSTVVEGSVSAYVAVMGDLLGSALQNLNNLIQMPYGCGEQNMLTTSSIVYVLKYLEATGRLTPELRTLATGYLQSGYQRQLNYKHSDGSFSAFGESDSEGSTWLTAFVVSCFTHARSHIFVDNDVLNKAVIWLKSLQQADGCFMNKGRVIHTLMKGGVEDDLSLAAYVTAAILGLGVPQNDPVLVNALTCLRNSLSHLTNPYTMALFAYVFSLANDLTTRTILLDKLYQIAQTSNGETYWEYTLQSGSSGGVSANVELTSYVSLALVSVSSVSTADILKAAQIVKWLVQRQNPNGGYSSTQDTVVAIHALSEYLRLTYSNTMNILVKVTGINGFMKQFQVYKNNSLLLQREDLPNVPGSYSLYVSGSGCAFIQCVLKYNIYPINSSAAFALNASVSHSGCNKQGLQHNVLRISVSYNGSRNATNMVLMEVGLPSGFSPNADSIAMLRTMANVKKVTTTPTSVTIYFEQLTSNTAVYQLIIEQNFLVKNVKPVVIRIWDYYLKEESAEISYTVLPCD